MLQGTFELHKRDRATCDAEHETYMHMDTTFVQQKSCNTGSNCWGSEGVSHDFFQYSKEDHSDSGKVVVASPSPPPPPRHPATPDNLNIHMPYGDILPSEGAFDLFK